VLTSLDERDLESVGLKGQVESEVGLLAGLAQDAGLDGVVASAREIALVRDETGPGFKIVTPGIRPDWAGRGDQKRVMSPGEAVRRGADFLVVGRPITEAEDPKGAAVRILSEMQA
jgi:orotidine-5'-phosphate decarboxylase